jgi:hypothetical protein
VIEHGKASLLDGLKSLTRSVNKEGKFNPPVSDETVDRVLERIYEQTKDRRFQRIRRKRRGPGHIEGIQTSIKRATKK